MENIKQDTTNALYSAFVNAGKAIYGSTIEMSDREYHLRGADIFGNLIQCSGSNIDIKTLDEVAVALYKISGADSMDTGRKIFQDTDKFKLEYSLNDSENILRIESLPARESTVYQVEFRKLPLSKYDVY